MKLAALLVLGAIGGLAGPASGQEAIPREYGFKFAGQTPEAAYFLSGIHRGAEPGSVEAWVWTINHGPADGVDDPDAKAELSIWRCEGRTFEVLKAELYREGVLLGASVVPPMVPKDIRPGTPMDMAWHVACDMDRRYSSLTLADLGAVYRTSRSE